MAAIERKTKRYPTDLTDAEWLRIEPLLPRFSKRGRKPSVDLREVLNAIRYMTRSGGGWRMLPKDFPPWQTVYWWFRRFCPVDNVSHHPRRGTDDGSRTLRSRGQS